MKAMMKLLMVLAGLLWMFAFTDAGIPLDVARKNPIKTSDSSKDVLPEQGNAENKVVDETPDTGLESNSVVGNNGTVDLTKVEKPMPVKNRKKLNLNKLVDPSNAVNGLRKRIKSTKRKLKAKTSHVGSDAPIPKIARKKPQNKTIDLSDLDEALPDRLKKKYGEYVKKGYGKNVEELANIRKKMRILRKITGPKPTDNKNSTKADPDLDELLFQGDEQLDADQLDSIIESTAEHYGVDLEPLRKHGVKSRSKRQAIKAPTATPKNKLWPINTSIKYWYDANVDTKTQGIIKKAFANIRNQTCLWFEEDEFAVPRLQFVNAGDSCASFVGHNPNRPGTNGIHQIEIGECIYRYGTISHEILHALGLHHQQDRYDRDDYLKNAAGLEILGKTNSDNYGSPYDYGSVMHYSSNLKTTQELYQQTIGHRVGPSFTDIAVLNQHYNCFCENPTVTCLNGGYPNPDNCDVCICPHGYGGRTCTGIDIGTNDESEIITVDSDECQTFKKSLGTPNNVRYTYYKKAWVQFKAASGKKVQLIFVKASDTVGSQSAGCDDNGVELKYTKSTFNLTGQVFCGNNDKFISYTNDDITTFTSSGNMAMLELYTQKNQINVTVKYRLVDSALDELPLSCDPIEEDDECMNVDTDEDCIRWNADEDENCEADPEYMLDQCPKTCGVC